MPRNTYLIRRASRYYARIRVPADLVSIMKRKEFKRSLGTGESDLARRRLCWAVALANAIFDYLRAHPMFTDKQLEEIARLFYENELERDNCTRIASPTEPELAVELEDKIATRARTLDEVKHALARVRTDLVDDEAIQILREHRVLGDDEMPDYDDEGYRQLCLYLLRALKAATLQSLKHDQGDFFSEPEDPLFRSEKPAHSTITSAASATNRPAGLSPLAEKMPSELIEKFFTEVEKTDVKERLAYKTSLKTFDQVTNGKAIALIAKQDVVNFKDKLLIAPINFRNLLKVDHIDKAITLNKKRGLPVLDKKTINAKYLSNLRVFFAWAKNNNLIQENPTDGVTAGALAGDKNAYGFINANVNMDSYVSCDTDQYLLDAVMGRCCGRSQC